MLREVLLDSRASRNNTCVPDGVGGTGQAKHPKPRVARAAAGGQRWWAGATVPCCGHSASSARCRGCQLFIEHAVSPWSLASRPGMTSPGPYQPLSLLPSCPWCLCSCYPGIPWSWCRSCPPISCCWKFLLSRICSKGVSHEALPNS